MMEQLSFSDKLKVLVDVSSSSGICIGSIFLLLFMAFLFLTTNKKNAKSSKKLYLMIYLILIVAVVGIYFSSLSDMFDYMMNNFFIAVYFPNLAIYLAAIISTNIILWRTIFNFREDKLLKVINTIIYCIIHYLLILVLNIVNKSSLNVFDQTSVYGNHDALALIGLTSTVFIVWIIFLIIYKTIRGKQKARMRVPVRRVIRYKKKMPDAISTVNAPYTVKGNMVYKKDNYSDLVRFYEEKNNMLEQQYQNILKEKEEQENLYQQKAIENDLLEKYKNSLTLDDYKTVLNLLKKDDNKNSISSLAQNVSSEPQIIFSEPIKDTSLEVEEVEQPKLEELLNLYNSI